MAKKKSTLDELLAALGREPNSNVPQGAFPAPGASNAAPLPPSVAPRMNGTANPARRVAAAQHANPGGGVTNNFNELVSLLGGNGLQGVPTPPVSQRAGSRGAYPMQSPAPIPSAAVPQAPRDHPPDVVRRANPVSQKQAAALRKQQQQLQAASALQQRNSMNVRGTGAGRGSAAMTTGAGRGRPVGHDITAELQAVMANPNAAGAGAPRSQQMSQRPPSTAQRQVRQPNPAQVPTQVSAGGARVSQPRPITQEQIIVGHFCRHAIKTLARVMQGNEQAQAIEARLKNHIKKVWAEWVRGRITRPQLLESVSMYVKASDPAAASIDVIREFKAWYEQEYELQRRRTGVDAARRQPQAAQRNTNHPNSLNHDRNVAARSNMVSSAVANVNRARPVPANNPTQVSRPPLKQEPRFIPTAGTAGKTVAHKTLPARPPSGGRGGAAKAAAGRGVAGKSVASKSVGGKTISGPPGVSKGMVGPKASGNGMSQSVGRGQPNGKSLPGIKSQGAGRGMVVGRGSVGTLGNAAGVIGNTDGVVSAKNVPPPKPKVQRRTSGKGPTKTPPKGTPKSSVPRAKGPVPNPAISLVGPEAADLPLVTPGKRVLDTTNGSPTGSVLKKPKAISKGQKGTANKKKAPVIQAPLPGIKGPKPPPARPEMMKARAPKKPVPQIVAPSAPIGTSKIAVQPSSANAVAQPQKKARRADGDLNELSVVNNIVDIEDEEDKLGRDADRRAVVVEEILDYGADMLLVGARLRTKMQAITKRFGLDENISTDAMEMMSLAVRERLACLMESLRDVAAVRGEVSKREWSYETDGPNVHDKMERMRHDEERVLQVAAEMRVKRRKEQEEQEAKKIAGEAAKSDKKTKDSSAAAEAERKEKLALEKKRKEHSSQRDALSGLLRDLDKRRKKPLGKGLAPLEPLGKKSAALPPIPRRTGSESLGSGIGRIDRKKLDTLEKLKVLGPLKKLGRTSVGNNAVPSSKRDSKTEKKEAITLRDCLFLMESEFNMRKSPLLYKWHARLGV